MPSSQSSVESSAPRTPGQSVAEMNHSVAHAVGLAAENAAIIQQQDNVQAQATLSASVSRLLHIAAGDA